MRLNKKTGIIFIVSFFIGSVVLESCKKKNNEVDSETQSVVDNSICEQEFMQIQPTTNNLAIGTKGTGAKKLMAGAEVSGGCDTLAYVSGDTTYASGNYPVFKFDFGNCNAANYDGASRSGTLTVKFRGRPKLAGSTSLITLTNYQVHKASGTLTFTCDSIVVKTNASTTTTKGFDVSVYNAVCNGTGWSIRYSSTKTITMNNNGTPLYFYDDFTEVTGNSSGTNREGRNFSVVVNNIIKPANCKYITSGTVDVTPEGLAKRTVDYGNGNCDDDATFTVNGQTIAFKLK